MKIFSIIIFVLAFILLLTPLTQAIGGLGCPPERSWDTSSECAAVCHVDCFVDICDLSGGPITYHQCFSYCGDNVCDAAYENIDTCAEDCEDNEIHNCKDVYPYCNGVAGNPCLCDPDADPEVPANLADEGDICFFDNLAGEEGEYIIGNADNQLMQFRCANNILSDETDYPDGDADRYFNYAIISEFNNFELLRASNTYFDDFMTRLEDPTIVGLEDCDDTNPNINPGVPSDPAGNGDEDCDGDIDEDAVLGGEGNYGIADAIIVGEENGDLAFFICGGDDIDLVDFDFANQDSDLEPYYIRKNFCETITIDFEQGAETFQCAPITQGNFYQWVEFGDEIYEAVPFVGTIVEDVMTYGNDAVAGDRIWYTDGTDYSTNEEDGYGPYIWDAAQCVGTELFEIDPESTAFVIDVISPPGKTTADLPLGIESNLITLNIKANTGGQDIPLEELEYELAFKDGATTTSLYTSAICNNEEGASDPGGVTCSVPYDPICDASSGYYCNVDSGYCETETPDVTIDIPVCDAAGNEVDLHLGRGEYVLEIRGIDATQVERIGWLTILITQDGQYNPDFTEQGSCPQDDECFLGYNETNNMPMCVEQGYYEGDFLCSSNSEGESEWATRTSVIASTLKTYGDTISGAAYSLNCNQGDAALNQYAASGEETNFCVMNIYEDGQVADTIVGVGLELPIDDANNGIVNILDEMDIGAVREVGGELIVDECSGIPPIQDELFYNCVGKKLWYNPALQVAIFSKESVDLDGDHSVFDNILDFFESLFGDPQAVDGSVGTPPISRRANIMYYATSGTSSKEIYGGIEYMNYESSGGTTYIMRKTLALKTDGFGNICELLESKEEMFDPNDYNCYYPPAGDDTTQFLTTVYGSDTLGDLTIPLKFY